MTIAPASWGMSQRYSTRKPLLALLSAYLVNKKSRSCTGNCPRIWAGSQKPALLLLKHTNAMMKSAPLRDNSHGDYTTNRDGKPIPASVTLSIDLTRQSIGGLRF